MDTPPKGRQQLPNDAGILKVAITKSYYRNSAGVLLLYDITRHSTFEHLDDWLNEARLQIQPYQAVFLLIGTKLDLEDMRQVSIEEARRFAEDRDMSLMETSAKTGAQVREAFMMIANELYEMAEAGNIQPCDGWEGIKRGLPPPSTVGVGSGRQTNERINLSGFVDSQKHRCCNY
ncbi:hypothetical protein GJ496_010935 [Pomphorhynchus laevis]|nr:hypothetical protein GJ496_010935 [Pomphorhynchus laevis]